MEKALIVGGLGQVGRELYLELARELGENNVINSDIVDQPDFDGRYEVLDCLDRKAFHQLISREEITHVYHLAALLSATAEKKVDFAWKLSTEGLFNVLELAREGHIRNVFWPSSIAVFGPTTPRVDTPQSTIIEPRSVYGIGKLTGEMWCQYYNQRYGVDVRSIRYPGLIGWKSLPGGGTTDYAVDIFYSALKGESFESFLNPDTFLPMMHMADAVRATFEISHAPSDSIKVRTSYNLAAMSFSPETLTKEIKKHLPDFHITYKPDFRQAIADTWPRSIDDSAARRDWGWKEQYDLEGLVKDMIANLQAVV